MAGLDLKDNDEALFPDLDQYDSDDDDELYEKASFIVNNELKTEKVIESTDDDLPF